MSIDPRLARKLDECAVTLERVCRHKKAPGKRFVADLRARCSTNRVFGLRVDDAVHPVHVDEIRISRSRITLGSVTVCAIGIDTMDWLDDAGDPKCEPREVYALFDDRRDLRLPMEFIDA